MTSEEVTNAVMAWVDATLPTLAGVYDHIPSLHNQAMPDAVVDVARVQVVPSSELFPELRLEQLWIKVHAMEVSIMVDNSDPGPAAQQVRDYEGLLTASLLADSTLGGRVPMTSKRIDYDFTPPFVERPDGTRGREMIVRMFVAELLQED